MPKQFFNYKNKEIIDHSIDKSLNSKLFKKVLLLLTILIILKNRKYHKLVKALLKVEKKDQTLL